MKLNRENKMSEAEKLPPISYQGRCLSRRQGVVFSFLIFIILFFQAGFIQAQGNTEVNQNTENSNPAPQAVVGTPNPPKMKPAPKSANVAAQQARLQEIEQAQQIFEQAKAAYHKKDYNQAFELCQKSISIDSTKPDYWFMTAQASYERYKQSKDEVNLNQCYQAFEKVVQINPQIAGVYRTLFVIAAKKGNFVAAKKYLYKGYLAENDKPTKEYFLNRIRIINYLTLFKIL